MKGSRQRLPINYMDKRIKEHKIMSLVKAEKYLQEKGFLDHVIELEASTEQLWQKLLQLLVWKKA